MCGVAMLVPSKTANGEPANSGSVEERTCAPGAEMSGFSRWPKSVGPADEKLVMMPERPVWISSDVAADRDLRLPARRGGRGDEPLAVEVGDHLDREAGRDRDRVRVAGPVVAHDHPDRARGGGAVRLREEAAGAALDERDLPLQRAGRQRRLEQFGVGRRAAEVTVGGLAVRPVSRPTSTSVCGVVAHAPGTPSAVGTTGKGFRPWSEGETTVSAWPK